MTVKDMIAELQNHQPDEQVCIYFYVYNYNVGALELHPIYPDAKDIREYHGDVSIEVLADKNLSIADVEQIREEAANEAIEDLKREIAAL